ncbi:glycosyl transferase [Granulicella sibirica]|uniref:Glycosyl transferase n=2 Tax=Granulicella sibirica TaxID=2479048 RepID=A0A4Q0T3C2_9BACT|nr:glycosyl transferase [Granulicella sibirica]
MESISVVIPTYNRAALLRRAIQTVIEATTPKDEIIVVDDGSTDDTSRVPSEFEREVRYLRVPNGGAGAARNVGVEAATHDLVGFADSDDEWLPSRLDKQRTLMETRRDLVFSFSNFGQLFPDGSIEHAWGKQWHEDSRGWDEILGAGQPCSALIPLLPGVADVPVHIGSMYRNQLHTNYINVNTVLARRSLAGEAFRFGIGLPTWEECECFARLTRLGPCAYLDVDTALQRAHGGPRLTDADSIQVATARLLIISRTWATDEVFVREHGEEMHAIVEGLNKQLARGFLLRGHFAQAREAAARLHHGGLEKAILRLPAPLLSQALTLYRARRKS